MGVEYALRFPHSDPNAVVRIIERFGGLQGIHPGSTQVELRKKGRAEGMPDAAIRVEAFGLYFCDYGGSGQQFLGELVARLVSEFGEVTITKIE